MSETELSAAHAGIADRFFGALEEGSEAKVLARLIHDIGVVRLDWRATALAV